MTLAALGLLWQHGFHVPLYDEYLYIVPVLAGDRQVTLSWLWEFYGDNRTPLAKLVNVALLGATGNSFLAGPWFNVLALSSVALALMVTARQIRGCSRYVDALFPLILLSWSQWENLVWGMNLHFVLGHAILFSVLCLIVKGRSSLPMSMDLLLGVLVALLPACGPSPLAYVPALVVWLVYLACRNGAAGRIGRAMVLGAFALLASAMVVLYFAGHSRGAASYPLDVAASLRGALELLSMSLVSQKLAAARPWTLAPELWVVLAMGLILFIVTSGLFLLRVAIRQPPERPRALLRKVPGVSRLLGE